MSEQTKQIINQIAIPNGSSAENYDLAAKYDGVGEQIDTKYLPLSGGTMSGNISLGSSYGLEGTTTSGNTFEVFRVIDGSSVQVGGSYPELKLKGSGARPNYNDKGIALVGDFDDYLPLAGSKTVTGPVTFSGGDGTKAGKIILPNKTGGGQITDGGTSTLFGFVTENILTVGHTTSSLALRGAGANPTYTGNGKAAKAIVLAGDLANGATSGLVHQDANGDVVINKGVITIKDNSHGHTLSNISDWSEEKNAILSSVEKDVDDKVSEIMGTTPDVLNTIEAIAAALKDNPEIVDGILDAVGTKVDKAGDILSGRLQFSMSNPHIHFINTAEEEGSRTNWYIQAHEGQFGFGSSWTSAIRATSLGDLIVPRTITAHNKLTVNNDGAEISGSWAIGTDGETGSFKVNTSNGGAIIFGKEGPNSGTMLRFDQTDGTPRLRFRASSTAGAMVWEQRETNAKLHIDLGPDPKRLTFSYNNQKSRVQANCDIDGQAGSVAKALTLKINGGTIENTDLFTFNGSANKTFDITPAKLGVPVLSANNIFDGEQRMANKNHCPTMYDIAGGIGCSLKNTRALDNQAIIGELLLPTSTNSGDGTANTSNVVANEMGVYIISDWGKVSSDPNHGKITSKTLVGKFTSNGWIGNASSLYDSTTNSAGKLKWEGDHMLYAENRSGSKLHFGTDALYRHISTGYLKLLDAGNYNSYSPQLDGTGAKGVWGIDITGNANTATTASSVAWANVSGKPTATQSGSGLMSSTDKTKLDGIAANANNYSLPNATSSTLGGVKIGSNISVSSGTISLSKANVTNALGYTPPTTNTTYSAGTGLSLSNTTFSVTFANSTLYKVGDDAWFGDQDVAGAFCIKGNNGNTSLRMIGYTSGAANLIYNSSDKCIDVTFN